jgi:hypothetical protein
VGAGVAWSSHAPESTDPRDGAWGGGRFEFVPGGLYRDFSLSATEGRFGGADGTFVYGRNGVGLTSRLEVQCVNVSGNRAVVAGTIRESSNASFVGLTASSWLIDNGDTTSTTRDQESGIFINNPEDEAAFPDGYPRVCPSATEAPWGAVQFLDVTWGDLVVHDAAD